MLTTERWTRADRFAVVPELSRADRMMREMGRRIRQRREFLKLSQSALGEGVLARLIEMGAGPSGGGPRVVRQATISDWERGVRAPDLISVVALARELGMTVGKLVTGQDCG